MTAAVESDLGEDERPIPREVVKPREVGLESLWGLEVDIEAGEVGEPELEILRRRIVHIRDKAARVFAPRRPGEALEEALDRARSVPPHDRSRDLVADRVAEHGRVAGAQGDSCPDPRLNRADAPAVPEERHMLLPGEPHHDAEAVAVGGIQEPAGRHCVGADRVEAVRRDLRQIALHVILCVLAPARVGTERAVGDSADPELAVADKDEATADPRSERRRAAVGDRHVPRHGTIRLGKQRLTPLG